MLPLLPLILTIAPEIARWVSGDQASKTVSAMTDVVMSVAGTDDPEKAAQIIANDPAKAAELRVQLAKIASDAENSQRQNELDIFKNQLSDDADKRKVDFDAFKSSIEDISSARNQTLELDRQKSPMAWAPSVISIIIIIAFAWMLYIVLNTNISQTNANIANVLLGTLAAMATQVANYWLGSSSGSFHKDRLLNLAQERLSQSVPAHLLPHPSPVVPVEVRKSDRNVKNDEFDSINIPATRNIQ